MNLTLWLCQMNRIFGYVDIQAWISHQVESYSRLYNLICADLILQEDRIQFVSGYFNQLHLFLQSGVRGVNTFVEKQNFPAFERCATHDRWTRSFTSSTMPKIGYNMRKILAGKSNPHKLGFTVWDGLRLHCIEITIESTSDWNLHN